MKESFDALVLFAKVPETGRVKTRLGREIGPGSAARLYGHFLEYLSWRLSRLPGGWKGYVAVAPGPPLARIRPFFPSAEDWAFFRQKGPDLGDRMLNASRKVKSLGARRVVLAGTDCLELSVGQLRKASEILSRKDLALGKARDGGYFLLAWKNPRAVYMAGVPWSTPEALERTVRNCLHSGGTCGFLSPKSDIDTKADLARVVRKLDPRNPATPLLLKGIKKAIRVKMP